MSGTLRVTVLGCGSSGGVPRATGDWGVCDPNEPKNRRTRCGIMLQKWNGQATSASEATTVLIDTPPELRQQLADAAPSHLDAVLISHDHADQIHGFDDIRAFFIKQRSQIPTFIDAKTRLSFMQRFGYAFMSEGGYPAIARDAGHMTPLIPVEIDGPGGKLEVLPLDQDHGFSRSLGFRIGPIAYSNDLVDMPEATLAQLGGLQLWIVDALRDTPHPTHAHVAKALEWILELKPQRAVLTNMHIDLDYQALKARLPLGVEPAYDGWAGEYPV
ncbi:MBL fold metallo-hydrolase [Candidatus Viadribacter manganicus]|uniref:Phosphoribosyl 1,2-cyclic phosphodiesterase n=1 Tax=Candidatus Viadribacter manganicus TaxID=1759059 RepID=A0A1B1AD61_9PROT|nr:MBL fold metallo-hydrolase [Candidatus Viadribacter manganicus]ANP44491.1 phosphoribosyl 1,2-cyclic phosphodiesterase [Candidatus Viadribacter manganicus]